MSSQIVYYRLRKHNTAVLEDRAIDFGVDHENGKSRMVQQAATLSDTLRHDVLQRYEYTPLPEKDCIRILELEHCSGGEQGPLIGRITVMH